MHGICTYLDLSIHRNLCHISHILTSTMCASSDSIFAKVCTVHTSTTVSLPSTVNQSVCYWSTVKMSNREKAVLLSLYVSKFFCTFGSKLHSRWLAMKTSLPIKSYCLVAKYSEPISYSYVIYLDCNAF